MKFVGVVEAHAAVLDLQQPRVGIVLLKAYHYQFEQLEGRFKRAAAGHAKLADEIEIVLVAPRWLHRGTNAHRALRVHGRPILRHCAALLFKPAAHRLVSVHCQLVARRAQLQFLANEPQQIIHLRSRALEKRNRFGRHHITSSRSA